MLNVIDNQGQLQQEDNWQLGTDAAADNNTITALTAAKEAEVDFATLSAVVIDPDAELDDLAKLVHCKLIAINFPRFVDGQGYSLARILREDLHFKGEIRAVGDVRCDQLADLQRCGITSFALNDDQDLALAQRLLTPLARPYQADAVQPSPLFRQR